MVHESQAISPRSLLLTAAVCALLAQPALAGSWCGNPVVPCDPNDPASPCYIPPAPDPRCEPDQCDKCTKSPCYTGTGVFVQTAHDLSLPAVGSNLTASRRYESSHMIDGPTGIGWTSSLAAHLYHTAYLLAAPSTYQTEADITMPTGARYRFVNSGGGFVPPLGRYDTLVQNADGSFDMTLQRSTAVLHFGADGTLQTSTDEYGNVQTWSYDANGRVLQVADSAGSGRFLNVTWGADGRISGVADSAGRQVAYLYDTRGVMTNYHDPLNRVTSYSYVAGRYTWMLNAVVDNWNRIVTQVSYDQEDRTLTYTEEGETYTYTYVYQGNTSLTAKADSTGATWVYTYGAGGLVNVATPPSAANVAPTYDLFNADGTVAQHTDALGVISLFSYDAQARLTSVTLDSQGPNSVRFDYAYDPTFVNCVAAVTPVKPASGQVDPTWQGWRFDYHLATDPAPGALFHVYRVESDGATLDTVATYTYDAHGRPLSATDADGGTTSYTYDAQGDLASVTRPANNDAGTLPATTYTYDAAGRVLSKTDPIGMSTTYTLDAVGRFTSTTVSPPAAGASLSYTETLSYDSFDSSSGLVFATTVDPNGSTSSMGRDAYGRLIRETDAAGGVTAYAYTRDLLASKTDADDNITTYSYDSLKRLISTTFPDGTKESYTYYGNGTLHTQTDRKSQTLSFLYDHLGRLGSKTYPSGAAVSWVYLGQSVTEVADANISPAETHTLTYDASYRLASETQGARGTLSYTYTPGDRRASLAVAGGANAAYSYYPDGSLDTIQWSPVSGQFKFTYTARGDYQEIQYPNGQIREYTYDAQGRPVQLESVHPTAGTLAAYAFGYDVNNSTGQPGMVGLRSSITATVPALGLANALTKYYYDAAYRLIRTDYPAAPPFNGEVDQWSYDLLGNRLSSSVNGGNQSYGYEKIGSNSDNWTRLLNDGTFGYSYDANGNVTSMSGAPGSQTFSWDVDNRPTGRSGQGTATLSTYDYRSRLATLTQGGQAGSFLYSGDTPVQFAGQATKSFLFGPLRDELLATDQGGQVYFAVLDDHDSVVGLDDASGTMHYSAAYDAWGSTRAATGSVQSLFGHIGTVADGSFTLNQVRYYSPGVGRFLQEDPGGMDSRAAKQWSALMSVARPQPTLAEPEAQPPNEIALVPHINDGDRSYPYGDNNPVMFRDPGGRDNVIVAFVLVIVLIYELFEVEKCEQGFEYCTSACQYKFCGACVTGPGPDIPKGQCFMGCYLICARKAHCTREEVMLVLKELTLHEVVHSTPAFH